MARLALKPDSSFFRKIAIGVVGTQSAAADLSKKGHEIVELERGSMDTKLWKEVKRKRVRIPDLLCRNCGLRFESRAKTTADLSMSHSLTDAARAWDFGMVDTDVIAFPVCEATDEKYWSAGRLGQDLSSYWHERNWVRWRLRGRINYFQVGAFRSTPHTRISTKGVTEGSETSISWDAVFSARTGIVESLAGQKITIRRASDGHRHTRTVLSGMQIFVSLGESVEVNQVIASVVKPITISELACPKQLPNDYISRLLSSRERTQRFTGVKLARLRNETAYEEAVANLSVDDEEDVYIRLEAISYLASVGKQPARQLFAKYLGSSDPQTQLEAVIALGETATPEAVELLCEILDDAQQPYFLRSAAAWCLSRVNREEAITRLVKAFSDVDQNIREEALEGIVSIGGLSVPILLAGLRETNEDVAAGCAEALRQHRSIPDEALTKLLEDIKTAKFSHWTVWLLGHLPREHVAPAIAQLQDSAPQLHYAISLLWSFVESWIARRWELSPGSTFPAHAEEAHDV